MSTPRSPCTEVTVPPLRTPRTGGNGIGEAAAIALLFFLYSAVRAPVPAVNEPHYLSKAERFYHPDFAPADLFLNSANPHLVFYATFGLLTPWLSPTAVAWVGRLIGSILLAVGWTLWARALLQSPSISHDAIHAGIPGSLVESEGSETEEPRPLGTSLTHVPGGAFLTAALFLSFAAVGNFSGEWVIGGIESKVIAYALILLSLAWRWEHRPRLAAVALGGAIAFHPVVGLWAFLAAVLAEIMLPAAGSLTRREAIVLGLILALAAAPGLIPAVLTLGGGDAAATARANYIQVFVRLKHHLDPTTFQRFAYLLYAALLAVWVIGERTCPVESWTGRWWRWFVGGTVAVAGIGLLVGWHGGEPWTMPGRDLRTTLLKFYPFRLADALLPVAVSLTLVRWSHRRWPMARPWMRPLLWATAAVVPFGIVILRPPADRFPDRLSPAERADWIAICRAIEERTPPESVLVTAARRHGLRWRSRRAEWVNYKDIPQDTPSLLEWERRLVLLQDWFRSWAGRSLTENDLARLREFTGGDYLLLEHDSTTGPERWTVTPWLRQGRFALFRLHAEPSEPRPSG